MARAQGRLHLPAQPEHNPGQAGAAHAQPRRPPPLRGAAGLRHPSRAGPTWLTDSAPPKGCSQVTPRPRLPFLICRRKCLTDKVTVKITEGNSDKRLAQAHRCSECSSLPLWEAGLGGPGRRVNVPQPGPPPTTAALATGPSVGGLLAQGPVLTLWPTVAWSVPLLRALPPGCPPEAGGEPDTYLGSPRLGRLAGPGHSKGALSSTGLPGRQAASWTLCGLVTGRQERVGRSGEARVEKVMGRT